MTSSGNNNSNHLSNASSPATGNNFAIIDEIFPRDNYETQRALAQLDMAIEDKCKFILVGPKMLGEQTARWLAVGSMLHRSSVMLSIGCIVCFYRWPSWRRLWMSACGGAAVCSALYWCCWSRDPCSNYTVETEVDNLKELQFMEPRMNSAVVLMRKDDKPRQRFQFALLSIASLLVALKKFSVI